MAMNSGKNAKSPKKFAQFYFTLLVGLSGAVIGVSVGWISAAHRSTAVDGELDAARWQTVGAYCAGVPVGGLTLGLTSRFIGYRLSVALCQFLAFVGWLLLTQAEPLVDEQLIVVLGRFIHGLAAGGLGLLAPTYIAHIANFDLRGRMQTFHQVFIFFGVFFSYTSGLVITYPILTILCMLWPYVFLFMVYSFLPESPYYMYNKSNPHAIKSTMSRINGETYDVDYDYCGVQKYMGEIGKESADEGKLIRRMSVIGAGLVAFQQLCGANALMFHAEEVIGGFIATEVPSEKAQTLTVAMYTIQLVLCMISVELVEFVGRKCMLIVSALGMFACLSTLIVRHTMRTENCDIEPDNRLSVALVVLYACFYSIGWGPVVMTVYTEIVHFNKWFSNVIYAAGQCIMFAIVYMYFNVNTLSGNTYSLWMYAASCALSVPFVWYYVPETRGLRLHRIQSVLLARGKCDEKSGRSP